MAFPGDTPGACQRIGTRILTAPMRAEKHAPRVTRIRLRNAQAANKRTFAAIKSARGARGTRSRQVSESYSAPKMTAAAAMKNTSAKGELLISKVRANLEKRSTCGAKSTILMAFSSITQALAQEHRGTKAKPKNSSDHRRVPSTLSVVLVCRLPQQTHYTGKHSRNANGGHRSPAQRHHRDNDRIACPTCAGLNDEPARPESRHRPPPVGPFQYGN